jgi:hypothetical protein
MKLVLVKEDARHGTAICGGKGQEKVENVLGVFSFKPRKKNLGGSYELYYSH